MTTNELLEMTMLHTLGMLDDDECAAYEAAFAAASPHVQMNIRAEAERMADLGALMPESEPRDELRDIVIAAVRAAVHERSNDRRLASERGAAPAVAGTISRASYAQPKLNRSPRVHRVWRATSIGLAAAVVAMTVVTINIQQTYNHAGGNAFIAKIYDTYGGEFVDDTMFDASTKRVVLASNSETSIMGASVFANPDWESARLLVKNLRQQPGDEPYRLVVLDADGNVVREVTTFSSNGSVQSIDIKVNLNTENRLAIYQGMTEDIARTEPLLKSVEADM